MKLLRLAMWRDVRARGGEFVAIVATVVLGVALFAASFDAYQNLTLSYQAMYDDLAFADVWATGGDPGAVAAAGLAIPGVAAAEPRVVGETPIRIGGHDQLARVVGLPDGREPAVDRVMLLRGRALDPGRVDEVLAEQHLGLEPGATISVLTQAGWQPATIVGVVASPEYLWPARSRQEVLVPQDQWGVLFGSETLASALPTTSTHNEVQFRLAPDAAPGTLDRLQAAAIAAGAAATTTRADQPSNAALGEDLAGFQELSVALPAMFLLAGALALAILLGRLVATQRVQIGVLAANGLGRNQILRHYLGFGIAVGLAGAIPGAILGGLLASVISQMYTATIAVPVTVVRIRPETIAIGLAIGVLAGALAAVAPARRAARTAPAEAMRGTGPAGRGGRSLVERLIPPLRRLPSRWRFALRSPGRNRRRTLSTIVGVMIAATLILVSAGMIDTVQVLLDRQFRDVQREDAVVQLALPVAASEVGARLAGPDVAAVEPSIALPAVLANGDRRYETSVVGFVPGTTMHGFRTRDGAHLDLPADGLLLGTALQDRLGVDVGSTLTVDVGGRSTTSVVAGFVDEPFGTYAYGSLPTVAALAGTATTDPEVSQAYVRFADGSSSTAVTDRLSAASGVAAVIDSRALYGLAQQFMGLFYAMVGLALVFGGVIAFAVIFTTMNANIAERTSELAALRTLGMSNRTVAWLVTGENLLLTVIGLVPGLIVGYLGAAVFMASFSSDLFRFDLAMKPQTFVLTAVTILVVGLASGWPALRNVARIDLGRTVRERAT